jgi:hypothetical protein
MAVYYARWDANMAAINKVLAEKGIDPAGGD